MDVEYEKSKEWWKNNEADNLRKSARLRQFSNVIPQEEPAVDLIATGATGQLPTINQKALVKTSKLTETVPPPTSLALQDKKLVHDQVQWKLKKIVLGHTGWVRSVCIDPLNQFFCTGSSDNTIKAWDLATGRLKVTLTGHIMAVRGVVVSDRHPYLFSCGEDKRVKCWDLEYNRVIRDYHGHVGGVYSLDLHPSLDVIVTGGRDSSARVWDIRTREAIHVLTGHKQAISQVKCQAAEPQVITASMDATVRLWDLAAGKTRSELTQHKKSVRALAIHPQEYTFASGAGDGSIKQWRCPEGSLLVNFDGVEGSIINTLSVNEDNVTVAGCDDGTLAFFDWPTGRKFQQVSVPAVEGSLESERGIFASVFDQSGTRLITCGADKSIKIWAEEDSNLT